MMRTYSVLAKGCPEIIVLEQSDYKFVVYKEYPDNGNILMFYACDTENSNADIWVHAVPFAEKFDSYADAKLLADDRNAKIGIYHEVKNVKS